MPFSRLVTDQGRHFKNNSLTKGCTIVVVHDCTVEYEHHNNSLAERRNKSIVEMLRKEFSHNPIASLERVVVEVEKNLNFSYHVDLDKMPIEVWHGSQHMWDPTERKKKTE